MKIGITINLGNYESLRIDSSEHERLGLAKAELRLAIADFYKYIPNKKILEMFNVEVPE